MAKLEKQRENIISAIKKATGLPDEIFEDEEIKEKINKIEFNPKIVTTKTVDADDLKYLYFKSSFEPKNDLEKIKERDIELRDKNNVIKTIKEIADDDSKKDFLFKLNAAGNLELKELETMELYKKTLFFNGEPLNYNAENLDKSETLIPTLDEAKNINFLKDVGKRAEKLKNNNFTPEYNELISNYFVAKQCNGLSEIDFENIDLLRRSKEEYPYKLIIKLANYFKENGSDVLTGGVVGSWQNSDLKKKADILEEYIKKAQSIESKPEEINSACNDFLQLVKAQNANIDNFFKEKAKEIILKNKAITDQTINIFNNTVVQGRITKIMEEEAAIEEKRKQERNRREIFIPINSSHAEEEIEDDGLETDDEEEKESGLSNQEEYEPDNAFVFSKEYDEENIKKKQEKEIAKVIKATAMENKNNKEEIEGRLNLLEKRGQELINKKEKNASSNITMTAVFTVVVSITVSAIAFILGLAFLPAVGIGLGIGVSGGLLVYGSGDNRDKEFDKRIEDVNIAKKANEKQLGKEITLAITNEQKINEQIRATDQNLLNLNNINKKENAPAQS